MLSCADWSAASSVPALYIWTFTVSFTACGLGWTPKDVASFLWPKELKEWTAFEWGAALTAPFFLVCLWGLAKTARLYAQHRVKGWQRQRERQQQREA